MPGGGLNDKNYGWSANDKQRRNGHAPGSWIPQGRTHSAVPKNLAARAKIPAAIEGMGMPVSLLDFCRRAGIREGQRNFRHEVMMKHQHQQQVQLHHRQQPCGRSTP